MKAINMADLRELASANYAREWNNCFAEVCLVEAAIPILRDKRKRTPALLGRCFRKYLDRTYLEVPEVRSQVCKLESQSIR